MGPLLFTDEGAWKMLSAGKVCGPGPPLWKPHPQPSLLRGLLEAVQQDLFNEERRGSL